MLAALPLLALPVLVYNLLALTLAGGFKDAVAADRLSAQLFVIPMASRAVWSVAKTNGKVALLSEREAEIYDRLDTNAEAEARAQQGQELTLTSLQAQAVRLNLHFDSGATLHLPAADLTSLTQALADTIAAADADSIRCAFYLGASRAVDDRVHDRDDFTPYLIQ